MGAGKGSVFIVEIDGQFTDANTVLAEPDDDHDELFIDSYSGISMENEDIRYLSSSTEQYMAVDYTTTSHVLVEQPVMIPSNPHKKRFQVAIVVDDSKLSRKMVLKAIKHHFHEILEAEDGIEAVAAVKTCLESGRHIDVIFMDSVMPNMNGLDACRAIRSMGYTGYIAGVTGNVVPEDVDRFCSAGANVLLAKPLPLSEVDKLLDGTV